MKATALLLTGLSGLGIFTIAGALQCYKGTTTIDALTTDDCDSGVTTCSRYTVFGSIPIFACGGSDDTAGACTHTTLLGVLANESCFCSEELCNAANATLDGQKAMSGAGDVRPATVAILAATVVAVAASIY